MNRDCPHEKLIIDLALFYKTEGRTSSHPDRCKKMDRICTAYSRGLISASEAIATLAEIENYWSHR